MGNDVMISVDPHKASNTAAVMDPVTRTVIAHQRFANTLAGYQQLRGFVEKWRERRWAVEGSHGAGRLLAQRLVADGESVLDVPAKLAAGPGLLPRSWSQDRCRRCGLHRAGRGEQRRRRRGARR